jgi:hypothetical protein
VRSDYQKIRALWSETASRAGTLDKWNKALVFNYLATAAEFTAPILNNQGNDAEGAEDARAFAKDMRSQDILRRGYDLTAKGLEIVGFGTVGGFLLAAVSNFLTQVWQRGSEVDLKPLVVQVLTTGGLATYVLRGMASAGQAAGTDIKEAWDRTLSSADPAKLLIASTLDSAEQSFYLALGTGRPSRIGLQVAGPAAAVVRMSAIALPIALVVYFLFASFTTPHPQKPLTFPKSY